MANLIDKLMSIDDTKVNEKNTGVVYSHKLQKMLGESEPVAIEVRELPYRYILEVMNTAIVKNGRPSAEKAVKAQTRIILSGVTNIPFKDEALQAKFGAASPADLVEKLIGGEIPKVFEKISEISGYFENDEEEEEAEELEDIEEIKNL